MHYYILDKKRKEILPFLKELKRDFYLAGGTALALQIGHRRSIDFDFFSKKEFNPNELMAKIEIVFKKFNPVEVQNEKNTLSVIVNDVKLTFLYFPYPLLSRPKKEKYLRLASIEDIACMKLSAIISRATNKDYIDLYFIVQKIPIEKILKLAKKKMPQLDENLILKSLIYFKDIEKEKIDFISGQRVSFKDVEEFLRNTVKKYKIKK